MAFSLPFRINWHLTKSRAMKSCFVNTLSSRHSIFTGPLDARVQIYALVTCQHMFNVCKRLCLRRARADLSDCWVYMCVHLKHEHCLAIGVLFRSNFVRI